MVKISFYDPDVARPNPRKKTHGGFTLNWVDELGWKDDPFKEKYADLADFEDERQELNLFFIKERTFGTITGKKGSGKSLLLQWLESEIGSYNTMDVQRIDAEHISSAAKLLITIADQHRGLFSKGKPIDEGELKKLFSQKAKRTYVLLIDNANELDQAQKDILTSFASRERKLLFASQTPLQLSLDDELELILEKRKAKQLSIILSHRIEQVGGSGILPFNQTVIEKMGSDSNTLYEFLDLARETAINIALKKTTLEEDIELDDLALKEEEKAKTNSTKAKEKAEDKKTKKQREYDELIESLTKDM